MQFRCVTEGLLGVGRGEGDSLLSIRLCLFVHYVHYIRVIPSPIISNISLSSLQMIKSLVYKAYPNIEVSAFKFTLINIDIIFLYTQQQGQILYSVAHEWHTL